MTRALQTRRNWRQKPTKSYGCLRLERAVRLNDSDADTRNPDVARAGRVLKKLGGPVLGLLGPRSTKTSVVDIVFLHAEAHDALGKPEAFGGLGLVAAGVFEGFDDHLAFHIVQRGVERFLDHRSAGFGGLERGRKVMSVDDIVVAKDYGAFDAVLQFTDVTGPVVAGQHVDRGGGNAPDIFVIGLAVFFDKEVSKKQDIGSAFAKRRNVNGKHVQPVIEILAELFFFDEAFQIAVGGGDDADIGFNGFGTADALELAFLKDAEQTDLRGRGEVTNFIEKDRAAMGQFKAALALRDGARERAFLVAEQFAFNDRFGERGAIDAYERFAGAQAIVVDSMCDEFFADAAFSTDEDGGVALGDLSDEVVDDLHGMRVTDDIGGPESVFELGLEARILFEEAMAFLLSFLAKTDSLSDHGSDDRQETHIFFQGDGVGEQTINA